MHCEWYRAAMKELLDSSIESQIIRQLKGKPLPTTEIVGRIQKVRPGTPKQSVYLALRKLKKKEVVAVSRKMVSLHQIWISKMRNFFSDASEVFSDSKEVSLTKLQEKEHISYKFNSLLGLDMFWGHAFALFMNDMQSGSSIYLYNPHEWFLIVREQSETLLVKETKRRGISFVLLLAGHTPMDIQARKYFDGTHARCHSLGEDLFEKNYYVNCFGDFLIEVWLDPAAAKEIESVYANHSAVTSEVRDRLQAIIEKKKYTHKMKISRNAAKATKIKNTFKKFFII
jgi:hypothetical protein